MRYNNTYYQHPICLHDVVINKYDANIIDMLIRKSDHLSKEVASFIHCIKENKIILKRYAKN